MSGWRHANAIAAALEERRRGLLFDLVEHGGHLLVKLLDLLGGQVRPEGARMVVVGEARVSPTNWRYGATSVTVVA